jgi:hypothetical protein
MPYANTAVDVTILAESADRLLVKFLRYAKTASDEADVLKVNVETLTYRTAILVPSANTYTPNGFPPGVQIASANANSGATAYVVAMLANGAVEVVGATGNLNAGETFTSALASVHSSFVLGSVVTPARQLEIISIDSEISGVATKVAIEWSGANSSVFVTAHLLSAGSGYFGRNELQGSIPTPATSDGNIFLSTYGMGAESSYDITLELRKLAGFAQPSIY